MSNSEGFTMLSRLGLALAALTLTAVQSIHALSSGPGMPEYNDFESVENTDLVNLVTGDFTYSVPLMTVPGPGLGFPLVLNYHAGIQPEQEASWVGLGWNLQAGAITRRVNNVPDEFQATFINEILSSQHIHGWMASIGWNSYTVGLSWDSESGLGGMVGFSIGKTVGGEGSPFSLGISATAGVNGVYEGVGVTGSISAGRDVGDARMSAGLSIGIHSKNGATSGFGGGVSFQDQVGKGKDAISTSASLANVGVSLTSRGVNAGATLGVGFSMNSSVQGVVQQSSSGAWVPFWTPWTGYMELNWGTWDIYIDGFQEDYYYGFLNSNATGMGCTPGSDDCFQSQESYKPCSGCPDKKRVKKMDYNISGEFLKIPGSNEHLKLGYSGEDIYSVQTQGLSGTFKPYRRDDGDYYTFLSNQRFSSQEQCSGNFGYIGSWFGGTCTRHEDITYGRYFEGGVSMDNSGNVVTTGGTAIPSRNHHDLSNSMIWRFDSEMGGGQYTDPATRDDGSLVSAASTRIEPKYADNQIVGWVITNASGVKYLYTESVINYAEQVFSSQTADLNQKKWTRRETPGYPYAWLLTAILSTDYVKMSSDACNQIGDAGCLPKDGDVGGWVRFDYSSPRTVSWRTPIGSQTMPSAYHQMKTDPDLESSYIASYSAAMGLKSVRYLSRIETPTHSAQLRLADESREDNLPPAIPEIGVPANFEEGASAGNMVCPADADITMPKHSYDVIIDNAVSGAQVNLVVGLKTLVTVVKPNSNQRDRSPPPLTCAVADQEELLGPFTLSSVSQGTATITLPEKTKITRVRVVYGSETAANATAKLSLLQGITLVNKAFGGKEVSAVRFKYDYSLAQKTPNSRSDFLSDGGRWGRLTLRSVQLGASSDGPWNLPYVFRYESSINHSYNPVKKDYWGYYCGTCTEMRRQPDGSANAWNLVQITTPSAAEIHVGYEPKTLNFSENAPVSFDGDSIGNFFGINNRVANMSNLSVSGALEGASNPDEIPEELAAVTFAGRNIVFLGRMDLKFGKTNSIEVDFSKMPTINGAQYVMEGPTLVIPPNSASGSAVGMSGANPINSSRKTCPSVSSCTYAVGRTSNQPFGIETFFSHNSVAAVTEPVKRPYWVRVWAIVDKSSPAPVVYGGGVRVSRLSFREPFSGKENAVTYNYRSAATPTLPQPMSNYSLDIRRSEAVGIKPYLGSPGILHGQVTATFDFANSEPYSTEYNFITSRDLPVRIMLSQAEGNPGNNLRSKVKILDRSSLWGSLWKKVDSNSSHQAVRVFSAQWANKIDVDLKSDLGLSTESLDLMKSGQLVLKDNDVNTQVHSDNTTQKKYFGVSQKLWSNRFVSKACEDAELPDKNSCLVNAEGAYATQVEMVRFIPLERRKKSLQDGVEGEIETNYFDFLSGSPLAEIRKNILRNDVPEYLVTLGSLAHHRYPDMRDSNMLTQEFSATTFRFDEDPATKNFALLSASDLSSVFSSQFTLWNNFGGAFSKPKLYRKAENYALLDRTDFQLPSIAMAGNSKWTSQGRNTAYDDFGHVVEFENSTANLRNSQIFGYGQSLPVAFAQNARRSEIFYQSFETKEFAINMPGHTNFAAVGLRSKTGAKSLKVVNCQEQSDGSYVDKLECAIPTVTTWKGRPHSSFWWPFPCNADFSPVFSTQGECHSHFQNQCGYFESYRCGSYQTTGGYSRDKSMVCFDLPPLPKNQSYVASAWYYDQYRGSNPDTPQDPVYLDKTTQVTRPGIFLGDPSAGGGCQVENHPNGANLTATGDPVAPAGNSDWNASQRAFGDSKWTRIWAELTPASICSNSDNLENPILCLYASKNKGGTDVFYDEVRIRPKNSFLTTFTYDHRSNLTSTADPNEVTKHFNYDVFGNLTGIRNDDGILLSEQSKKQGLEAEFSVRMTKNFIGRCEIFEVISSPAGHDTRFEFISAGTAATYQYQNGSDGKPVHLLCPETWETVPLNLLMEATGKVHTFPVDIHPVTLVLDPGTPRLGSTPWPDHYNGKLYDMVTGSNGTHGGAYYGFKLPTKQDLVDMDYFPPNGVLEKFRITFEILNIPNFYGYRADLPDGTPIIGTEKYQRMHLKYNYFLEDTHLHNSQFVGGAFGLHQGSVRWYLQGASQPTDACPQGRCFDVIEGEDLLCGEEQAQDCDLSTQPANELFGIRKTMEWPVSSAAIAPSLQNMAPVNAGGHNIVTGDFFGTHTKPYTFIFSLYRHFKYPAVNNALVMAWHPQTLSPVPGSEHQVVPSGSFNWNGKKTSIKITIIPVLQGDP